MPFGIKNRRKIIEGVSNLENFKIGTVRGQWYPSAEGLPVGQLAGNWAQALHGSPGIIYVVWSYGTPIAWRTAGAEWIIPNTRYSVTTTHHQSLMRQGVTMRDERIAKALAEIGC